MSKTNEVLSEQKFLEAEKEYEFQKMEDAREESMQSAIDSFKENGREKNDFVPTGEIIDSPIF